jgi:ATP-dependent Clp protease ATP-binding subunit ClpA
VVRQSFKPEFLNRLDDVVMLGTPQMRCDVADAVMTSRMRYGE